METKKMKNSAIIVQTLATFAIAYLTVLTGFLYAWPSYNVANFMSNQTILDQPMTEWEISLLGSLSNLGSLLVTPFCGYALNKIGRKYTCMLFGLPYIFTWLIVSISKNSTVIIAAMTLAGIGAGGQPVITVFIGEIADDRIRGGLATTVVSGYFLGLLISYVFGGYLTYQQVIYTHLTLCVLYLVFLMMLKESPVYLMQNGREKEAAESIAFYQQVSESSKEVEHEISKIKMQLNPCIDKISNEESDPELNQSLLTNGNKEQPVIPRPTSLWQFLKKSESSQKAILSIVMIMSLSILMGSIVLQVFAEPLLIAAAPEVPSNLGAILLAVVFLISSGVCSFVVDRFGRRFLMMTSALTCGVLTLIIGIQLQFNIAPYWFAIACIFLYTFFYSIGAATIPFVLAAEVFLPEVRGFGNSVGMGVMWIINFLTLIIYSFLTEIGLWLSFYFFSAVSFVTLVYCYYYLPETKGLPCDAIQQLFVKKKKNEAV